MQGVRLPFTVILRLTRHYSINLSPANRSLLLASTATAGLWVTITIP
ncbi:hypothetical protein HY792_03650 [Candidatus Desantisbacteria bacterium]|nr:hypothetical protein [Candidatus Desantisbacteria bacterium]